ncbi:MAG: 3-deoxy-manno-octulosonate cytidylyltransferase [Rickettsiella sp.]|nr:3-deoxy-manno-octulosonate cytidylyltransferase [Rickettsiella sp.]
MKNIIIIPARYNSSRFPGKPLVGIKGKSLIFRTWSIAMSVKSIDDVYIATDHVDIQKHAMNFGAKVIMTGNCPNGTERVFAATKKLALQTNDLVINLQGDAVLTLPRVVQALVDSMIKNDSVLIGTLAVQITQSDYVAMQQSKLNGNVGGSMVVFDKKQNALYFSKSMIPYLRNTTLGILPLYRHIGLYAYRFSALKKYISLPATVLEKVEGLEQLRALENGIPIRVVIVDYKGRTHASIDSPNDVKQVERIIGKEGELIPFN